MKFSTRIEDAYDENGNRTVDPATDSEFGTTAALSRCEGRDAQG